MSQMTRSTVLLALVSLCSLPAGSQGLLGRVGAAAPPESVTVAVTVDSASPRAALQAFFAATHANDIEGAAKFLDLSAPLANTRRAELARRLGAVLDSRLWIDLERISPLASGDTEDGLPLDRELIGEVVGAGKRMVPVRLARQVRDGRGQWVFSSSTVAQIDSIFEALPDHWVREHLPPTLRINGPFGLQRWQWLALLILLPLSAVIGFVLAGPLQVVLKKIVSRTQTDFDDALVDSAHGPITLLVGVLASRMLLRWIALPGPTETFVLDLQRAFIVVAAFWILLRVIGALQEVLPATTWGKSHSALRSLIPLGGRMARLFVLIIGLLTVVASFGYPIATILAGLGIGGIAVALGAQKSLEHFFGSVSIGIDQPFRVGDWVIVDGTVEGEVEAIGLRSTRIRTLERTLVSIPNGRLAETRTENFGHRDRIRLRTTIALEYGTTAAQVAQVRDGIEAMLRAHELTWTGRVVVRLFQFSDSSIDLDVFCWIVTDDVDEFRRIREQHYLGMMRVVEEAGAAFAFPTRTVHLKGGMKVEG